MKWNEVATMRCSIARTLSIVGDRWTLLILRNAFARTRRFDDFAQQLGMTRHLLADRLNKLVEQGVLRKVAYQQQPLRYEYRLTDKGRALYPILQAIIAWGDRFMDDGRGPPQLFVHKRCGKRFTASVVCSECGEPLDPREVTVALGPGAAGGAPT